MFTLFEKLIEAFAWIKIALSPTIIGAFLGVIAYANLSSPMGLTVGIALTFIGLIVGIIWATRIAKKGSTSEFISRVNASPDLDKTNKSE